MRIIYIHQYFNTPDMRGGTRSYEMARRWARLGHEVHVVAASRDDHGARKDGRSERIDGIRVHWLRVAYSNRMSNPRRVVAFLRFAYLAALKALKLPADVVFATSTPLSVALPGVIAARKWNVPMVFEVRDLWPEMPIAIGALSNPMLIWLARKFELYAYRHSERVIALSPGMAAGVAGRGYPEKRIFVVPNACDIESFNVGPDAGLKWLERYPSLHDKPIVLYAGALGKMNGVGYLAKIAAAMLSMDPAVRFLVVGDGAERERISNEARALGVFEKNFWMLDPLPKREIPAVLAAASVATSLFVDVKEMWNNSANKFFDALACGRPLMINYGGWHADLLRRYRAGIIVPPDDAPQAAALLHGLLVLPKRLEQCGRAAQKLGRERFDRDLLANRALSVLEDAVTQRRCRPHHPKLDE